MFAAGLLLVGSCDVPLVSLSWGDISAGVSRHGIRLNSGGSFWRTVLLVGDVELLLEVGESQLEKGRERPKR